MSYGIKELKAVEAAALNKESPFIYSGSGKNINNQKKRGKIKPFRAAGFIVAIIIIATITLGRGNIYPSAISERLIEETDVQYADAVMSKEIIFQQAMRDGDIPEDTAKLLEESGVEVGYITKEAFIKSLHNLGELANNGDFVQGSQTAGELVLKMGDKIITADNFINEVNSDTKLYNAFTRATYGRAAYYYDEAAQKVFQKIGTNRNNYNTEKEFDDVMNSKVGEGSDINVNSVSLVKKTRKNERGEDVVYYEYEENGTSASSKKSAEEFINQVREKNPANTTNESALFSADALKVADTISKEERSSLFFVTFMENISKMKAGEGSSSKINEAMNFLYDSVETEVVDVNTGEIIKVKGSALESPSLYAVLTGEKVDTSLVENYSSDRILKTIENQINVNESGSTISGTIASSSKMKGSIGRFINSGIEKASSALLDIVRPTVSNSLMNNSFKTIKGIGAGEFLVEGAVNVGKSLAKASGATAGDATAVANYARLNNSIVAMDAAIDRMNRSPFDITSKNTFLGSLVYKFALSIRNSGFNSVLSGFSTILNTTKSSILSILPTTYADEVSSYLNSFGNCETYGTIGAVGTAHCSEIATFDSSTLNDPFNDSGFVSFINNNTTLNSSGGRTINKNSVLAQFIIYNNERETPLGVVDGGILESLRSSSSSISFASNILTMIKAWLGTSETEKRIASGAAYVNSSSNPDWQVYKYAQRYVSLARATSALRQYSNDKTAYQNMRYFEGNENPVTAFLREYYASR